MKTTLTVQTELNSADLIRENSRSEIKEFILGLDAAIAEVEFTENLVLALAESLCRDMTSAEMKAISEKISAMEGYKP